jgi:hypothetical protein
MELLNAFEYVKTFISLIRKERPPIGSKLLIECNKYSDNELLAIIAYNDIIKKICKFNEIVFQF